MNKKGAIFTGYVLWGMLGTLFASIAIPAGINADKKAHQDTQDYYINDIYFEPDGEPVNEHSPAPTVPEPATLVMVGTFLLAGGLIKKGIK